MLGNLKYCLGIEVRHDRRRKTILINQSAYTKLLAQKRVVDKCEDIRTPTNESEFLTRLMQYDHTASTWPYWELVGALMHISTCSRPDIMHAVGGVVKYCEN